MRVCIVEKYSDGFDINDLFECYFFYLYEDQIYHDHSWVDFVT